LRPGSFDGDAGKGHNTRQNSERDTQQVFHCYSPLVACG
jgi:hypothetical protein